MATNSRISVVLENGKVLSIYCHYDGYLSHNGKILKEHYNSYDKAVELVSGGDLSILAENINPTDSTHSFASPQDNVCVYYNRDRGETNKPTEYDSIDRYQIYASMKAFKHYEYIYLFKDGEWLCNNTSY